MTIEDLTVAELDQLKKSFSLIADQGGIGEGVLREVEDDLDQAEEGIEKARDKLATGRSEAPPTRASLVDGRVGRDQTPIS